MMQITHHHRPPMAGPSGPRREKGYIMALFGLMLVPMLLMVGMSVDVGSWYNRAAEMQRAADAGALAGVVWLPNAGTARTVARDVAAKNGFPQSGNVSVEAEPSNASPERRLRVTIHDSSVSSFFYEHLGGSRIGITRTSFAEYVLPVPLGSPRNFFGTGKLLRDGTVPGFESEELHQAINTYCSDKVNGDRHQPMSNVGSRCSGTQSERKPYELYIEAKEGRPGIIDVLLYDPRFNPDDVPNNQQVGETCLLANPGDWQGPWSGSNNTTIYGPAQYRTRSNSSTNTYGTVRTLEPGQSVTHRRDRIQYREGNWQCTPIWGIEKTQDRYFSSAGSRRNEAYTFTLYRADDTPLDDTDNPVHCSMTYNQDTPFDSISYLGSLRWNKLCEILPSHPDGRYILRATNSGSSSPNVDGENDWGLVAKYRTGGLCDGRNDEMCPRVYGKEAISVRAVADTTVASFFLTEILPEHAGKTLVIELYDPGEGGNFIEIMSPSGTNSWQPVRFDYSAPGTTSGTNRPSVSMRSGNSDIYNGKVLTISVDLSGYEPPADNNWWQIRYTFRTGVNIDDRTTWTARVIGDPVHLIEEN